MLGALNGAFPMEEQNNMFFTIWYGVHNRRTGELRFSSGGHPPAILLRSGANRRGADRIDSTSFLGKIGNIAIGAMPNAVFKEEIETLREDDRVLVYSDGAFEVRETEDRMLTPERLAEFLVSDPSRGPAEVYRWVHSLNGDKPLPDDFSMLELRF